jgi:hypothetical protein
VTETVKQEAPQTGAEATGKFAGKFETPEALEKAYLELQSATTQAAQAKAAAEQAATDKPALDLAREMFKAAGTEALSPEQAELLKKYGETDTPPAKTDEKKDEPKNFGSKPEHAGLAEGTDFATYDFLVDKGLTHDVVRGYMGKMADGSFSAEDAKAIGDKLGLPAAVVEGYAKPRTAVKGDQGKPAAKADTGITADQYGQIVTSVGGEAEYQKLTDWARKGGVTPQEAEGFNAAMDTGNVAVIMQAVRGLKAMRDAASGTEPARRIGGGPAPSVEPFATQAEMATAMSDPRYDTSETYRNQVMARVAVSRI